MSIRPFDFTLYVLPLVRLGRCKVYLFFLPGVRMIGRLRSASQQEFLLRMRIMAAAVVDGCGWLSTESTVLGIFPAKTACTGIF